jgi:hypothetical protein
MLGIAQVSVMQSVILQCTIMPRDNLLRVVMDSVILHGTIILSVILQCNIMPRGIFAACHYGVCHFAACRYGECTIILSVILQCNIMLRSMFSQGTLIEGEGSVQLTALH